MALECICFATQTQGHRQQKRNSPKHCEDRNKQTSLSLKDIDLCEIVKRSEDGQNKHNDYECHLKGEKRQNLINKIKMYLDDYDDRPVMKGKSIGGDEGKALGQTGFGPLIKYPGYVDYDHPYFSDPYNKMPNLAMTVGQGRTNPCVPLPVRNWDECYGNGQSQKLSTLGGSPGYEVNAKNNDGRCHCAERRGETPKCPAAGSSSPAPSGYGGPPSNPSQSQDGFMLSPRKMAMTPDTPHGGSCRYICIPLPNDS